MHRTLLTVGSSIIAVALSALAGCKKNDPPPMDLAPGSVEFCIVANDVDDPEAIQKLNDYFTALGTDPSKRAELKKLAEEGNPPPLPEMTCKAFGKDTLYRWAEVDPSKQDSVYSGTKHDSSDPQWQNAEK